MTSLIYDTKLTTEIDLETASVSYVRKKDIRHSLQFSEYLGKRLKLGILESVTSTSLFGCTCIHRTTRTKLRMTTIHTQSADNCYAYFLATRNCSSQPSSSNM